MRSAAGVSRARVAATQTTALDVAYGPILLQIMAFNHWPTRRAELAASLAVALSPSHPRAASATASAISRRTMAVGFLRRPLCRHRREDGTSAKDTDPDFAGAGNGQRRRGRPGRADPGVAAPRD